MTREQLNRLVAQIADGIMVLADERDGHPPLPVTRTLAEEPARNMRDRVACLRAQSAAMTPDFGARWLR